MSDKSSLKKLNLGCGHRFHRDWTNLDFVSTGEAVIAHNLLSGVPFPDQSFDVVYHSHVLEHFSRADGKAFIAECFRVLKPGGIIRIAVPDLEGIVRHYLDALQKAIAGEKGWDANYDWMMLELYDQVVRNQSGGAMAEYLQRDVIENEKFVFERIGEEGRGLRAAFLEAKKKDNTQRKAGYTFVKKPLLVRMLSPKIYRHKIKQHFLREEEQKYRDSTEHAAIGKFRTGGEIHQWMYDRFSLARLLAETGFVSAEVKTASGSAIPEWISYELDQRRDGTIFKPDSLFMEARKG